MNTFNINQYGITVTNDTGDKSMIRTSSEYYNEAKEAVMSADWERFGTLVLMDEAEDETPKVVIIGGMSGLIGMITGMSIGDMVEDDSDEFEAEDSFVSTATTVATAKGLLEDGLISPEDLGIEIPLPDGHEHDLSQWSGSPIFYPTREMAREQSDRWGMFWDYHDFGIASPAGYRYATVPRLSQAPTAPGGYDWVCLPREE